MARPQARGFIRLAVHEPLIRSTTGSTKATARQGRQEDSGEPTDKGGFLLAPHTGQVSTANFASRRWRSAIVSTVHSARWPSIFVSEYEDFA